MSKKVIVIGAGGHSKVIADIIQKSGDILVGYLDDAQSDVLGKVRDCVKYPDCYFVIAIGNNHVRKNISQQYSNIKYYTAVHPSAVIGADVTIGEGTVVMANAVVNPSTSIGKHCIINTGTIVEHDNKISDYVHLSPRAVLCGTVVVGECCHIGAGVSVKNNITIGKDITVGVGAAVVHNLENAGIYVGIPARWKK